MIVGRLQNNNYTNKDGQMVYGVQIMVEEIEFAESKNASQQSNEGRAQPQQQSMDFMQIPDDLDTELPFN